MDQLWTTPIRFDLLRGQDIDSSGRLEGRSSRVTGRGGSVSSSGSNSSKNIFRVLVLEPNRNRYPFDVPSIRS